MIRRFRRLIQGPEPDEIAPMDWVRKRGQAGVGQVESLSGDYALVNWFVGIKEILPSSLLARVKPRGQQFDIRRRRD